MAGSGVFLGDIDRDGDLDLATPNGWLRAPADIAGGIWTAFPITGAGKDEVLLADFNHDGRLDLATCDAHSAEEFAWFESPAEPTQPAWVKRVIHPAFGAHHPEAVDFNRDGWTDILMGLELTNISLFISNRDGTFARQQIDTVAGHNARTGDFDADGDADVFGCDWIGHPPAKIYTNGGDYALPLSAWTYVPVTASHEQTFGLAFADVNRDSQVDILSGRFWYQNPGGNLTGAWTQRALPAGMHALLDAPVDADGLADLIATKDEGALAIYWLEAADAAAASWTAIKVGSLPAASHALGTQGYRLGEIIPGGKPEIVLTAGDGAHYFNIPTINPQAGNWPSVKITANTSDEGIDIGDIDRDGWPDVIGTTGGSKRVEWYRNPGAGGGGNWAAHIVGTFPEADFPDRCAVADLNGDGRLDVVVTEENGGTGALTFWWEQPAVATSPDWPRHPIATLGSTNSMSVRDMDRDGDVDVLLGEHRGPDLRHFIHVNDGLGAFTAQIVGSGRESHLGARWADLDGDGDDDIISIAYDAPQNIHVWRNDASGITTAGTAAISPDGGSFTGSVMVTLTAATPGATVRYTLDGDEPDQASTAYSAPFTLQASATLKAKAFKDGLNPGPTRSAVFIISPDTGPPKIVSVTASGLPNEVRVVFDELIDEASAEAATSWQISGLVVGSAALAADGVTVVLSTTPMTDGVVYTLDVSGVRDRAAPPNVVPNAQATFAFTALPAAGLSHHWSFDETTGGTARDGVGGMHGTLDAAVWVPDGRRFGAVDFGGASRVGLGTLDLGGNALTISLWLRHRAAQTSVDPRLISKSTSTAEDAHYWMVSLTAVGGEERLRFRLKTGVSTTTLIASSGAVPLDEWVHAAAVYDGGAMRLFLGGQPVGSTSKSGAIAGSNAVQAAIGNQPQGAGTNGFDGAIDEVRIYNRALSQSEIGALVNGTAPPRFQAWVAGFGLSGPTAATVGGPGRGWSRQRRRIRIRRESGRCE